MFKRLLSYFIPIKVHQQSSDISRNLEVTWANGQLVLDSKNTNYSFGSLQRILRLGLLAIGQQNISDMRHILVLGVAGGSVIQTLVNEFKFEKQITGVEIDPAIIEIANEYFQLDKIPNLTIINDDAFAFALKTKDRYDLIIVDIFRDTEMPNFLFEPYFAERMGFLLQNNGFLLFNTMTLTEKHNQRNVDYLMHFDSKQFTARTIPRVEQHNELILVQKRR